MKKFLSLIFLSALFVSSYAQWQSVNPMSVARAQHEVIALKNGNIIAFGGYKDDLETTSAEQLNIANETWSSIADYPVPNRGAASALGDDGLVYVFGGAMGMSKTYAYDSNLNTWMSKTNILLDSWEASAATASNGKLYVIGGEGSTTSVQIFDPVSNSWSTGAEIPGNTVSSVAVTSSKGLIYLIGGHDGTYSTMLQSVRIYDPVNNSWSTGTDMPVALCQMAGAITNDDKIYIIGGKTNGGNNISPFFKTVYIYDIANNSWSAGVDYPIEIGEASAAYSNGAIYVVGGTNGTYQSAVYKLKVSGVISAIEKNNKSIAVFYNTNDNTIYLSSSEGIENISIFDLNGKSLWNGSATDFPLNVQSYNKGIYIIKINTSKGSITEKIIL